jgi:hypothetical protein
MESAAVKAISDYIKYDDGRNEDMADRNLTMVAHFRLLLFHFLSFMIIYFTCLQLNTTAPQRYVSLAT